ncbi:hypothetical protein PITC_018220 [Penicillium italicum]|uniref:Uncharacterized protein n=1 Tax=Penicillium italicum TaxID=40296 RepID=A0A0A2L8F5_PENIT|nr:hypothetical protein PITC_018220 [Penicillium italicum]
MEVRLTLAIACRHIQCRPMDRGKQHHEAGFAEFLKGTREHGWEMIMLTTMALEGAKQSLQAVREFLRWAK